MLAEGGLEAHAVDSRCEGHARLGHMLLVSAGTYKMTHNPVISCAMGSALA